MSEERQLSEISDTEEVYDEPRHREWISDLSGGAISEGNLDKVVNMFRNSLQQELDQYPVAGSSGAQNE